MGENIDGWLMEKILMDGQCLSLNVVMILKFLTVNFD